MKSALIFISLLLTSTSFGAEKPFLEYCQLHVHSTEENGEQLLIGDVQFASDDPETAEIFTENENPGSFMDLTASIRNIDDTFSVNLSQNGKILLKASVPHSQPEFSFTVGFIDRPNEPSDAAQFRRATLDCSYSIANHNE